jgi:hypothetical protein
MAVAHCDGHGPDGPREMAGWSMETSQTDVASADHEPVEVPRWWNMPYPTEPLYPVDLFVSAQRPHRRERSRPRGAHIRSRSQKRA